MAETKNIFHKIRSVLERKAIWAKPGAELQLKVGDEVFPARIAGLESAGLWLEITKGEQDLGQQVQDLSRESQWLGYLNFPTERYFFVAPVNRVSQSEQAIKLWLDYKTELFKLDRRHNPRIHLPPALRFVAFLEEVNGLSVQWPGEIMDLSGGGVRVQIQSPQATKVLGVGTEVLIKIVVHAEKTFHVHGFIRHIQSPTQGMLIFGVEASDEKVKSTIRLQAQALLLQQKLVTAGME